MCGPHGCRETIHACDFCGGLGLVEAAVVDRLTDAQLARWLHISPMLLNDVEWGRAELPPHAVQRLAEYEQDSP